MSRTLAAILALCCLALPARADDESGWLWSTAHAVPKETTTEGSGYFSIVEGHNSRLYIGTAKYRHNAYLVEFDPHSAEMRVAVDAHREIGTDATGFAAQAKIHTRNNVGASGKIYFGTKQGYPADGESRTDYAGGHPLVYDPATGKTRVYGIPVPHHGIISVTPDESRGVAYISTCNDARPVEDTHFLVLDLETGTYRDLLNCRHMYAFIVVDHRGRAYHPILGGEVARYDPETGTLERLKQTIDGAAPSEESLLAHPESHPINWEVSPDRRTLYAVAMSGNQLYSYDLTAEGDTLPGKRLGPLVADATKTDCRALCVAVDGTVWAGVAAARPEHEELLRVVSYRPGDAAPTDHGPIAIRNQDYTVFTDAEGEPLPWHHGVVKRDDGTLIPRYAIMGICAARDGTVYVTTLAPFTLHAIPPEQLRQQAGGQAAAPADSASKKRVPMVAAVVTEYRHNAHADVIVSRLFQGYGLDDRPPYPKMKLASLFTDQVPANDTSRGFAAKYGFPIHDSVSQTLTLGTDELAVDGVLLVAEHGSYPKSETGQTVYPKRRLFAEIAAVFEKTGRSVPVFVDKHLADNWDDAKWIYDTARRLNVPLMAGSSVPGLWRYPPLDVRRDARLREIVAVSYHTLDAYGFHALEFVQALAERRRGGETGVRSVQCLTGDAVWEAGRTGVYDADLLGAALARLKRPVPADRSLEDLVPEPVLFTIDYRDGLRVNILTLNGAVGEWSAAWRYADPAETESALFWTQEARPFDHFSYLVQGIETMLHTGRPAWPVERTLLTSGTLDALLISKKRGGERLQTPWLDVAYQSQWNWSQPPEPRAPRPIDAP